VKIAKSCVLIDEAAGAAGKNEDKVVVGGRLYGSSGWGYFTWRLFCVTFREGARSLLILIQFDVSLSLMLISSFCCRYAVASAPSKGEEAGSGAEKACSRSQEASYW
jgi:hypothetical protein